MKKQTKRLSAMLLAMILTVSLLSTAVFAEGASGLVIAADSVTAKTGEAVSVPVKVSGNPGIVALAITVSYDKDALELTNVTDGQLLGTEATVNHETAGVCGIVAENSTATADITANGTLVTLNFKAKTVGTHTVTVTVNSVANSDVASVAAATVNGTVTVQSAQPALENKTGATPAAACSFSEDNKTLNVTCDKACVVLVQKADGTYDRLTATKNDDGGYDFDVSSLPEGATLVVAVKGDANGDGIVNVLDCTAINRSLLQSSNNRYAPLDALEMETADANGDGVVNVLDCTTLNRSLLQSNNTRYAEIAW